MCPPHLQGALSSGCPESKRPSQPPLSFTPNVSKKSTRTTPSPPGALFPQLRPTHTFQFSSLQHPHSHSCHSSPRLDLWVLGYLNVPRNTLSSQEPSAGTLGEAHRPGWTIPVSRPLRQEQLGPRAKERVLRVGIERPYLEELSQLNKWQTLQVHPCSRRGRRQRSPGIRTPARLPLPPLASWCSSPRTLAGRCWPARLACCGPLPAGSRALIPARATLHRRGRSKAAPRPPLPPAPLLRRGAAGLSSAGRGRRLTSARLRPWPQACASAAALAAPK